MAFNLYEAMYPELMPSPEMELKLPRRRRRAPPAAVEQIQLPEQDVQEELPAEEPPPPPEVEPGVLSKIGNTALSGLSVVGNALGLGPSMVLDALAFENPFDQLLTPFSSENRSSGRDVLTKWGVTNPNDPDKWEAADFAGFALDVASGGPFWGAKLGSQALSKGGQALAKSGLLDDMMRLAPAGAGKNVARATMSVDDFLKVRPGEAGYLDDIAKAVPESGPVAPGSIIDDVVHGGAPEVATPPPAAASAAAAAEQSASIPAMITRKMRQQLKDSGLTDDQIREMTPQDAWSHINKAAPEINPASVADDIAKEAAPNPSVLPDPVEQMVNGGDAWNIERGRRWAQSMKDGGDDLAKASDEELAKFAGDKIGGLADLRFPFMEPNIVGQGPMGLKIAGALDKANDYLKGTAPVRMARMLFDNRVAGKKDKYAQQIAEEAYNLKPAARQAAVSAASDVGTKYDEIHKVFDETFKDIIPNAGEAVGDFSPGDIVRAADRNNYGQVLGAGKNGAQVQFVSPETGATKIVDLPLDQLSKATGTAADDVARRATDHVFNRVVRFAAERGGDVDEAVKRVLGQEAKVSDELAAGIRSLGDEMQTANRSIHQAIIDKGGNTNFLNESDLFEGGFEHLPRFVDAKQQESIMRAGGAKLMKTSHAGMKSRNIPTARIPADVVNEMMFDPAARGPDAVEHIMNYYKKYLDPQYNGDYPGDFTKQAEDIAAWIAGRPKKQLFTRSSVEDFLKYQLGAQSTSRTLDAIHATLAKTVGNEGVPLLNAFQTAGMNPEAAIKHLASIMGETVESLAGKKVPVDVLNGITAVMQPGMKSEWGQAIADAVDKFHRMFKDSVTLPFPSFWTRNFTSGQTVNLTSGYINSVGDISDYYKKLKEVKGMLKDGIPPEVYRDLKIHGVVPDLGFQDTTIYRNARGIGPSNPLKIKDTMREAAEKVADTPSVVDKIPGGTRARTVMNTATMTGSKMSENVEYANRVTMYMYLKSKGWSPAKAAEKVAELHFDYGDLSPFEKNFMKRLIPFYAFTRKSMPMVLGTLYGRPGGALAQLVRMSSSLGSSDATTPDYVAGSASIPLGESADGGNSYLTGFGFAHEDPLSFLGGGAQGALLEGLSRMTPLLKGPMEWATGESFFQKGPDGGRDLSSLDPGLGRTAANIASVFGRESTDPITFPGSDAIEFVLANSPASRFITTARTLTDTRKSLPSKISGLTTGMRIADISPAAQDAVLRERIQELQRQLGGRDFDTVTISAERLARMSPEQRAAYEELKSASNVLTKRAKQRKAIKELQVK